MPTNLEIIKNLKKVVYDIRIDVRFKQKEINLRYSVKNSLLTKENKASRNESNFYYQDGEKEINELAKKDPMELFELLVLKHLEKNVGYGKNPKQFQTPCYICNQRSLTTLGWSEEGYQDNLERFFCRLCRTSFGWIDLKDDPLELQAEMTKHYLIFTEKDIEKGEQRLNKANKELVNVHEYLSNKQQLLAKLQEIYRKLVRAQSCG